MKKFLVIFSKISNLLLSFFNLAMFFSIRMCWSGISKTLGYEKSESLFILWLPVMVWFILIAIFIVNILLFKFNNRNKWSYIMNGVNIIFFIVVMVIIALGAKDYMYFAWPYFFKYCLIALGVLLIYFIIFIYPKIELKNNKTFKYISFGLVIFLTVGYLTNLSFNSITYKPVVYIVEDTYQIVFSSKNESRAWISIGDEDFYDNYAGYNQSYTKVHKITIPMELLDEHKEYTIHCQKLTYRGPFGGFKGRDISETYTFRPIDTNDGLNYYAISDVHMGLKCSTNAVNHNKEKELLILAGDVISMVDSYDDAQYVNKVAFKMTKGEIPVIYARGNHELKGRYYEELHNFVGAKNEDFFYKFSFGNVYGMVLDVGEDHDDDYWEYYDTAYFDEYRESQINFVKKELESKEYLKYEYRLIISHIPITYINSRKNHYDFKKEMTSLLNQMDIDMVISGHQHEVLVFEPDAISPYENLTYNVDYNGKGNKTKIQLTDFNFPSFTVSKRGYTQTDDNKLTNKNSQIGLTVKVDFFYNVQTCIFNNSKGEEIDLVNPFEEIKYGNKIVYSLIDNKRVR